MSFTFPLSSPLRMAACTAAPQHFFDRLKSAAEKVLAQLLEPGSGDAAVKVFTLKQRIDFNIGVVC